MTVTTVEALTVEELYEKYIKPRSLRERLQLIALISEEAASNTVDQSQNAEEVHDLSELRGLGAEIWQGIDAQEYVNQLREEWEQPYSP
ncbi:MAG: hypothetical protein R2873_25555 [Caldilineaceae bacterium]